MLLVYINKNLIENIVIYNNELYFSDLDSNEEVFYSKVPSNEYVKGTDLYLEVQAILYDVLEFKEEKNIEAFKECCLMQYEKGIDSFSFKDLDVFLEETKDIELNIIQNSYQLVVLDFKALYYS